MSDHFAQIAEGLAAIAREFHSRGWLLGTSGNLSAVVTRDPLCLAMSPSGVDKGQLTPNQIVLIGEDARLLTQHTDKSSDGHSAKPSDESPLHLRIAKVVGAGAVLHTHSIWNTLASDVYFAEGGLAIEGYEMLKGLQGVKSHEHREWIPIIENSQDMPALAETIADTLSRQKDVHGFLLRRHGLYSWGTDLREAKRHIEIMEFLLEVLGRMKDEG